MRGLLLSEYKRLEFTEVDTPRPAPGEVLVRVKACGICGSDVHGFDGSTGRRIPPLVMGHEAAGVVESITEGCGSLKPGDRVTFDSTIYCGRCFFCERGQVNLCQNRKVLGVSCGDYRRHGAFAEYVAVPGHAVCPIPDTLSFEHAALIEAVAVAVHGVGLTPVRLGCSAVVIGAGMIGLLTLQVLRAAGCGRIISVDLEESRLKLAGGLGADYTLNASTGDPARMIRDLTSGFGADIVIEAVGVPATVRMAIDAVRKGGSVTLVGNVSPQAELPLQSVVTRQIAIQGSCGSAGEYQACIELLSRGAVKLGPLISAVAPLSDGPTWFERLYAREPNLMKVILQP